jgi:hypothetical protein
MESEFRIAVTTGPYRKEEIGLLTADEEGSRFGMVLELPGLSP